jgi:hypothetical protein
MKFLNKSFLVVLAIASLFIHVIVSQQKAVCADEGIKIQVAGISVQREFVGSNELESYYSGSRKSRTGIYDPSEIKCTVAINDPPKYTMASLERIEVAFVLSVGDSRILGINKAKSVISSFKDDTGKDFLVRKEAIYDHNSRRVKEFVDVRRDGTGLFSFEEQAWYPNSRILKAKIDGMPNPQAKKIHLSGKVYINTSATKKSYECNDVNLAEGQTFEAANYKFKILECSIEAGKDALSNFFSSNMDWWPDEYVTRVVFEISKLNKANNKPAKICSLNFSEDKNYISAGIPNNFGNSYIDTDWLESAGALVIYINGNRKKIDITVTLWEDIKEIEVPIDVEVGLGLEEGSKKDETKN